MKQATILLVLLFGVLSCETTEPPKPPTPKDPRTYTWTADTLAYPGSFQTLMRDIWASSPTDVYVVGHNDQPGPGTMYHFDGTRWTTTGFHSAEGGPISGAVSLSSIYGFGANNVYAVGTRTFQNPSPPPFFLDSSLVLRFDGAVWREETTVRGRFLNGVWGSMGSDVWVCGEDGTLFHYDGALWRKDSTLPRIQFKDIVGSGLNRYLLGGSHDNVSGQDTFFYFKKDGQIWFLSDSFVAISPSSDKWGVSSLWVSPTSRVYSSGRGVFEMRGNIWTRHLLVDTYLISIHGASDRNIFVAGGFSKVFHFNGTDWFQFVNLAQLNLIYTSVWAFDQEVFIVGYTAGNPQKTIVLHGR